MNSFASEKMLVLGVIILAGFVYVNVSSAVGTFLGMLTITYFVFVMKGTGIRILSGRKDISKSALVAVIMFAAWFIVASQIGSYFGNSFAAYDFGSVLKSIRASTNIPVLSADPNVSFIVYGIVIPIVETFGLIALPMIFFMKVFNYSLRFELKSWKMHTIAVLTAMVSALYHITVRQSSNYALAVDTVFFLLSTYLVFRYAKLLPAMFLHVYVNSAVLWGGI